MILLIVFAFLAGIVTILSPCILPLLPIILSSSVSDKDTYDYRPLGIILGFITSFTFFTLFLASIVQSFSISADSLRLFSVIVLGLFGVSLLLPQMQIYLETIFSQFSKYMPQTKNRKGLTGGIVIGASLGLIWTPCVGPILASVITLALSGTVTAQAFLITLAYAIGTALPMLLIMKGGQKALQSVPWLTQNTKKIQNVFGVFMILTAIVIALQFDRAFQAYILDTFPEYAEFITKIEDTDTVHTLLHENQM